MLRRSLLSSFSQIRLSRRALNGHGSGISPAMPYDAFPEVSRITRSICGLTNIIRIRPYSESLSNPKLTNLITSVMYSRRSIHSGKLTEDYSQRTPVTMDYSLGLPRESLPGLYGRPSLYQPLVEANADIVHIKLMRNNAFVTLTDSQGNKKIGVSAGKLIGKGMKLGRYAGEAAAEEIGRRVREMKTKSVVVKVNGSCFFRRKKEAILAFKDGYTFSKGDRNPVVFLEDTTRKPHNGCRRPKRRRV